MNKNNGDILITTTTTVVTKNLKTGKSTKKTDKSKEHRLQFGNKWFSAARLDCTGKEVCAKCDERGNCAFWKEVYYWTRDFD